jgi:hypothetical protein
MKKLLFDTYEPTGPFTIDDSGRVYSGYKQGQLYFESERQIEDLGYPARLVIVCLSK